MRQEVGGVKELVYQGTDLSSEKERKGGRFGG